MKKKAALVIMAAGMASRYGGNKQIDGMGPGGEILMDYSIMDAIRAGFTKIVFIIKPEMQQRMHEICGHKYEDQVEIRYAYQDFSSIPGGAPAQRVKPFGTVHAVLCAKSCVSEPFAVLNADDYYGVESFRQMIDFLHNVCSDREAAMMGYQLRNTVSPHGTVTRGICQVEDGHLVGVREIKKIRLLEDGAIVNVTDETVRELLDPIASVSMNFWGFSQAIFESMETAFARFVEQIAPGDLTAEYLLPMFIDEQLKSNALNVRVLPTSAIWFGVTYQEDRPKVVKALKELHAQGLY